MKDYLAEIPLFRRVPLAERHHLAALCELRRFPKGEVIFEEGEKATFVWIVKHGWIYLVKRTPQGGASTIGTITPDEVICGVSAFDQDTYSASAMAATETQLIKIPAQAFSALLDRYPRLTKRVLLTCCQRIRRMAEAISVAQAPVEQRMAYTLLHLRAHFGDTIPVTHHELARMAGTRWETSIRTLSAMKRRGWMKSSRGRVTILVPEKLRGLLSNGEASKAPHCDNRQP